MKPKTEKKLAEVVDFQSRQKAKTAASALDVVFYMQSIVERARMHAKYDAVLADLFKKLDGLK